MTIVAFPAVRGESTDMTDPTDLEECCAFLDRLASLPADLRRCEPSERSALLNRIADEATDISIKLGAGLDIEARRRLLARAEQRRGAAMAELAKLETKQ